MISFGHQVTASKRTFPPLPQSTRQPALLHTVMRPSAHQSSEATLRLWWIGAGDIIDNVLRLEMIKEEAVDGPVAAFDEGCREAVDVEPFDARSAFEAAVHELDVGVWMVCEEIEGP